MVKSCWRASLALQLLFPIQILLNCYQILYSNATDIKLGSSTYFFLLYPFLVLTKCEVLNLRVGKSRDSWLQRAYSGRRGDSLFCAPPQFPQYWRYWRLSDARSPQSARVRLARLNYPSAKKGTILQSKEEWKRGREKQKNGGKADKIDKLIFNIYCVYWTSRISYK